jgi:hypothetical protein
VAAPAPIVASTSIIVPAKAPTRPRSRQIRLSVDRVRVAMRRLAETDRRQAYERLRRLVWDGLWRRRLVTLALIVGANGAVLTVT